MKVCPVVCWLVALLLAGLITSCRSLPGGDESRESRLEIYEVVDASSTERTIAEELPMRSSCTLGGMPCTIHTERMVAMGSGIPIHVAEASAGVDHLGHLALIIHVAAEDEAPLSEWTRARIEHTVAIVVDGAVQYTGTLVSPLGRVIRIEGHYDEDELEGLLDTL